MSFGITNDNTKSIEYLEKYLLPTNEATSASILHNDGLNNITWKPRTQLLGGDVVGPNGGTTLDQIVTFADTTGKIITNSNITITGNNILNIPSNILLGPTGNVTTLSSNTTSGNINFILPPTQGTSGQFLQTDGTGNLSWITIDTGNIVGPASSDPNKIVVFNNITGTLAAMSNCSIVDAVGLTAPNSIITSEVVITTSQNNKTTIKAQTQTQDITYKLPPNIGTTDLKFLMTDGQNPATLSWASNYIPWSNPTTITIAGGTSHTLNVSSAISNKELLVIVNTTATHANVLPVILFSTWATFTGKSFEVAKYYDRYILYTLNADYTIDITLGSNGGLVTFSAVYWSYR
jgi:hypothetical protein